MRTEILNWSLKIEGRNTLGHIESTIYLYLSIFIVQSQMTIKPTILIHTIQRDIFITIIAIIQRWNYTFNIWLRIFITIIEAFNLNIEVYQSEFLVTQQLVQIQILTKHFTSKSTFKIFIRSNQEIGIYGSCSCLKHTIGKQIAHVSIYSSLELNVFQTLENGRHRAS